MILVTVGSTQFPFARMNALIGRLSAHHKRNEKIIFQYGSLTPQYYHPPIDLYPFIVQDKLLRYMKDARVIICHGGPATIYQALSFGKIPWVLPREKRFGEHLTDHQVTFCRFMAKQGLVNIITDQTMLYEIVAGSKPTRPLNHRNKRLLAFLDTLIAA